MQVALNLCRWLASRWADSLTGVTAVNVCVYCGRFSAAIMSESFELFVQGSSIIKLDCFEFLPENLYNLLKHVWIFCLFVLCPEYNVLQIMARKPA